MQKKKPSFEVIPNYRINCAQTGTNLTNCLRNKGCKDVACAPSLTVAGSTSTANYHQSIAAISWSEPNGAILTPKWCDAIGPDPMIRAALFIEHSSEI
jgi:hypothetical protein